MTSTSSIIQAMNDITLDEEEDGGIAFEVNEENNELEKYNGLDVKLCLVGRFIT